MVCSAVSSGSEASGLGSEEDRLDKQTRVLWEEAPQPLTLPDSPTDSSRTLIKGLLFFSSASLEASFLD